VAAYFYCGGISSGASVLGALAGAVGGARQRDLARTAHLVAFTALLPCPPLLIADLGMPWRFHHMLRLFKPSSPMNLGAWTLTVHGAFTTLQALRLLAEARKLPLLGPLHTRLPERALAVSGIPPALTQGGYTGVLLGTSSIPVWCASPLLGALFMASSLSTGAAAVTLASTLQGQKRPAEALAPLNLTFGAAELAALGGYLATSGPAARPLWKGRARLFLAGAAAASVAGMALEVAALGTPASRRLLIGLAAGATLLGGAFLRWAIVDAGHESARDREGTLEATRPSAGAPGWGGGRA
jgi:formate-dependent nitrite reductase membrane component NrfD